MAEKRPIRSLKELVLHPTDYAGVKKIIGMMGGKVTKEGEPGNLRYTATFTTKTKNGLRKEHSYSAMDSLSLLRYVCGTVGKKIGWIDPPARKAKIDVLDGDDQEML